jgi:hypothetical protein
VARELKEMIYALSALGVVVLGYIIIFLIAVRIIAPLLPIPPEDER